jgi:5-(carboxyamino)imidazole ribonucleotide synthase
VLRTAADLDLAFDAPGLLEKLIDFEKEIAVTVARNEQGEVVAYPAVECAFHPTANLVEFLFAPAGISPEIEEKAKDIAKDLILKLDLVGILAVGARYSSMRLLPAHTIVDTILSRPTLLPNLSSTSVP